MPAETINLAENHAEFMRECIASGRFDSASEVIRVALYLLQDRIALEERKRSELREMLDEAVAGGLSERTFEQIWDAAEARYRAQNA